MLSGAAPQHLPSLEISKPAIQVHEQPDLALVARSSDPPYLRGKVWAGGLKPLEELRAQV